MNEDQSAARFMAVVEQISLQAAVALDATGAALIAAVHFGVGTDSRSLSNKLGIEHALVLREINILSGRFLIIGKRDARTQRTWVELTSEARELASSASDLAIQSTL